MDLARCGHVLRKVAHIARLCSVRALLAFDSCNSAELACTLVGDRTGLTVQLSAPPVGAFTVEVIVSASAPVPSCVYVCDGGIRVAAALSGPPAQRLSATPSTFATAAFHCGSP